MNSTGPMPDEEAAGRAQAERPRLLEELAVLSGESRCHIQPERRRTCRVMSPIPVDADQVTDIRREAGAGEEGTAGRLRIPSTSSP